MLKEFLDRILGIKTKPRVENSQQVPEGIETQTGPRKEILTGGFVYVHPEECEGYTMFTDNIGNAVKFIHSAKTLKEKKEREKLYEEVGKREALYLANAMVAKIQKHLESNQ
ncbi:MAG: hypothetical protein WA052_03455 [Microgenomates group bacterium]